MKIFLLHVQYGVIKWNQTNRGLLAVTSQDVTWRYGGRLREAASIRSLRVATKSRSSGLYPERLKRKAMN
jgi:hypothetical protein